GGVVANGQPGSATMVDQSTAEKYAVYPNPVTNRLIVTSAMQTLKVADISIFDLQGKQYRVASTRQVSSNKVELDLVNMAAGIYMVRVQANGEMKMFRIVKQ
ncbi:MAG: T9SS type A sorting domain-containing protein, partial [Chitinophagaceae bacterium]